MGEGRICDLFQNNLRGTQWDVYMKDQHGWITVEAGHFEIQLSYFLHFRACLEVSLLNIISKL